MKRILFFLFFVAVMVVWCSIGFAVPETIGTAGSPWTSDATGQANGYFINNGGSAYTLDVTAGFPNIFTANFGGPYTSSAVSTNNASLSNIVFSSNSNVYGTIGIGAVFADIALTGATSVNFYGTVNTTTMHVATGSANFLSGTNNNNAAINFTGDGVVNLAPNTTVIGAITNQTADQGTLVLGSASVLDGAVGGLTGLKAINIVGGNNSAGIITTITGAVDTYAISLLTNTLNIGGALTMAPSGVINTTVASALVYGKIITTGAVTIGTGTVINEIIVGNTPIISALSIVGNYTAPITVNATINAGGTLDLTGSSGIIAPLNGSVTNNSGASLAIGTNAILLSNAYVQNSGSTLTLTANSSSSFGRITSSAGISSLSPGSTVNVTVGGYIPNNATLNVVQAAGLSAGTSPAIIRTEAGEAVYTPRVSFSGAIVNGNYVLTADHSTTGFASLADNSNARAVGSVLDNVTNPSSDMTNVLNTMEFLSNARTTSALDTMGPLVDRGILDTSTASLNNFLGSSLERIQNVLTLASSDNSESSGISSGDQSLLNGIWAKQSGGYLDQGTREGVEGYNAWNTGTAVGVDHLFNENLTLGASLGYAYGKVDSEANNGSVDINSAQGILYAGYQGTNMPYYVDLAGSFAENWYNGQRDITVATINRIADSSYEGQQSGVYAEGGYKFELGGNLKLTPLSSLQWTHLSIGSYTESNAGGLDLNVNRQSYDILESGLGVSMAYPVKFNWGNFTPEVHAKWLYDYINDNMVVTSTFTGGGAAFTSNGTRPTRNGANIGGKLSFDLKNDISLIAGIDTEIKDNFFGVSGTLSARYMF